MGVKPHDPSLSWIPPKRNQLFVMIKHPQTLAGWDGNGAVVPANIQDGDGGNSSKMRGLTSAGYTNASREEKAVRTFIRRPGNPNYSIEIVGETNRLELQSNV